MLNMPVGTHPQTHNIAQSIAQQMTSQFITPGSSPTNGNVNEASLAMNPNPFTNGGVSAFSQGGANTQQQ